MQIILFKMFSAILMLLLLCSPSRAQFIRMTLTIPTGFEVNVNPVDPMILEPPSGGSSASQFGTFKSQLRWIEMRARENTPFILTYRAATGPVRAVGTFEMYWLNDGTVNFSEANKLNSRKNVLQFFNLDKVMKDMPKGTPYFTAWLGVPVNRGGVITIEYP